MTERLTAVSLASVSPRRLNLLESLDLRVVVVRSDYDESKERGELHPRDRALRHAIGKADAAERTGPPLLIAADTVVDVDGTPLGKPNDAAQARAMLQALSGRWHTVHSGFAIFDRERGGRASGVESTLVRFAALDESWVNRYVDSGESLDKAGAYGIQGRGALLVERIDGDFYTVMGLPLARLASAVRELGYEMA
jgi:septum formation protein